MKFIKRLLLLSATVLIIVVLVQYPKLNIIAGYAAKNVSSSVYVANRTLQFTDSTDNNFSPVNIASSTIQPQEKSATSSVLGLLSRTAYYRPGLGSVLSLSDGSDTKVSYAPKRVLTPLDAPFPYGNAAPKDSLLSSVNYKVLDSTINAIFSPEEETRAVLVVYKDQIIGERYADGFSKESRLLGWSMTKSVLSTIYGILQYQGKLTIQQKAPVDLWRNDARNEITIHNLLQMNSGLAWDENYDAISDVTKMLFLEKDMTVAQAKKELVGKPNATWYYSSGTTNLLSGILRAQFPTHQEYLDFWYTDLIDKIGMYSMLVETDLAGNYVGSSYAWATTRDWAKFGLLYLHNGNWNGTQLFDPSWSEYVRTPTPTSQGKYGAQFWLNAEGRFPEVPTNMYFADGYQGQRVYILPDEDLVIVRFGLKGNYDENEFLKGILSAVEY